MSKFFLSFISGFINYFHLVLLITTSQYPLFIHIIHVNQMMITCFSTKSGRHNIAFVLFVFLGLNFGIHYLLIQSRPTPFSRFHENVENSVVVHMYTCKHCKKALASHRIANNMNDATRVRSRIHASIAKSPLPSYQLASDMNEYTQEFSPIPVIVVKSALATYKIARNKNEFTLE